jgi:hypothetical protein
VFFLVADIAWVVSTKQNPLLETSSGSASQETLCLLWNLKAYFRVHWIPTQSRNQNQINASSYDRNSMHLGKVGKLLPPYMAHHPRRQSSSYSPPWEPKISQINLVRTAIFYSVKTHFNNVLTSTPGISKLFLRFMFLHWNVVYISYVSRASYMLSQSNLPWRNYQKSASFEAAYFFTFYTFSLHPLF